MPHERCQTWPTENCLGAAARGGALAARAAYRHASSCTFVCCRAKRAPQLSIMCILRSNVPCTPAPRRTAISLRAVACGEEFVEHGRIRSRQNGKALVEPCHAGPIRAYCTLPMDLDYSAPWRRSSHFPRYESRRSVTSGPAPQEAGSSAASVFETSHALRRTPYFSLFVRRSNHHLWQRCSRAWRPVTKVTRISLKFRDG